MMTLQPGTTSGEVRFATVKCCPGVEGWERQPIADVFRNGAWQLDLGVPPYAGGFALAFFPQFVSPSPAANPSLTLVALSVRHAGALHKRLR